MANNSILHTYRSGLGNAASYQVSGKPWLTGATIVSSSTNAYGETLISFPSVTKSFTVVNRTTSSIYIHFDSRLTNVNVINQHHYMSLPNEDDSYGFDVRCKKVYISLATNSSGYASSFELHAELTGINVEDLPNNYISGSGINEIG